ncbi:Disease resistance-like protein DSC1 [Linum perenne]
MAVFISFRGSDTRQTFLGHLCAELRRQGIPILVDENFKLGREIWPEIATSIEKAKLSVIIFSESYPTSEWCLKEVALILEQHKSEGQAIITVFYKVSRKSVAKEWRYSDSFKTYDLENPVKAEEWKAALIEVVKIGRKGHVKLKQMSTVEYGGLYGIKPQMEAVRRLLDDPSDRICIISIRGMGGNGKSSLAEYAYRQVCDQYDDCCELGTYNEDKVRRELLCMSNKGHKKVLISLDGANKREQIETLAQLCDPFDAKTRIIVTTRNSSVFHGIGCNMFKIRNYEVSPLSSVHARELLILRLFGGSAPIDNDNKDLLTRMVDYAGGNPQVLRHLGEFLYYMTYPQRKSEMDKLKKTPLQKIHKMLVSSYDEIEDDETQTLFLDIAYIFVGQKKEYVTCMLDACDLDATNGVDDLVARSLIYLEEDRLCINSLHQGMAREIIRRKHSTKADPRSLVENRDEFRQLKASTSAERKDIRGINLDLSNMTDIQLSPDAFSGMYSLRFLRFYRYDPPYANVHAKEGLIFLPDGLRLLHWDGYPLKCLPPQYDPVNLVELQLLHGHDLELLWEGTKDLKNLKLINLSHCSKLKQLADLSQAPNLETIILEGCTSLVSLG